MESDARHDGFTVEDLLGAWECFQGDGIHGWDYWVLVFRREGGRIRVDSWLRDGSKPDGKLHLRFSHAGECVRTETGLRLYLKPVRRWRWRWWRPPAVSEKAEPYLTDIEPRGAGTFVVSHPETTAGALYYRRIAWPDARRGDRARC